MSPEPPAWLAAARSKWTWTGAARPDFADEPGPGQESVWDYPRPPVIVADERLVVVTGTGGQLAESNRSVRVLETAGAPTFYLPADDVDWDRLVAAPGSSMCEWKGAARYWAEGTGSMEPVAWDYPEPFPEFTALAGMVSFYPGRVVCTVAGERVRPQPGGFYGGWVTDEIVGPIKGEAGSQGW